MIGKNRVYRGHVTGTNHLPSVLLFLIVLILLALIAAFALLPQYMVCYQDGVEMVVPFLTEDGKGFSLEGTTGPMPYTGAVSTTVSIAPPDYSAISLGSDRSLGYMQCLYVPYNKVTAAGVESYVNEANRIGVKGLYLQMKNEEGKLAWMSTSAMASSYATNNAWDISATVAELKADGWYLVAELSCSIDTLLASADNALALKDAMGGVYTAGGGSWVDLWNRTVRAYIVKLCTDLITLGFDEIVLTHVEHPNAAVSYTRSIGAELDATACVMSFSVAVREALNDVLKENGAHLCATLSHDALTNAQPNGQSLETYLKVFDRLIVPTETYGDDCALFLALHADSTLRYVPRMTWTFSGGSWLLDTTG